MPHLMRCLLLPLLAIVCFATSLNAQPGNILLIIADDLGADSFPLTAGAGASLPPMPNISGLKNSGVLFSKAYAHPVCSPSRASIFRAVLLLLYYHQSS